MNLIPQKTVDFGISQLFKLRELISENSIVKIRLMQKYLHIFYLKLCIVIVKVIRTPKILRVPQFAQVPL